MNKKLIGYCRVSTKEQGLSGLGLDSQKNAIKNYASLVGGELIAEFTDVESGTKRERKGLMKAIDAAQEHGAVLVVKKLDRLSRGGYRIMSELEERGIVFIECDSPNDSQLVKEIKLSLARDEAKKISERTKAALDVIKERIGRDGYHTTLTGKVVKGLGSPSNLTYSACLKSVEVRRNKALSNPDNRKAAAMINHLHNSGMSYYNISLELTKYGFKTSRGNNFSDTQVRKIHKMFNN
jgi:DNA invertase Pin-like site-specific DNA recombinase